MLEPLLPIAAVGLATSVLSKSVADATQVDGTTLVPLGLAVISMIFVGRWIWTYSRDCERQRAKIDAQQKLIEYLVRESSDVSENDPHVRAMLSKMKTAGEPKAGKDKQ